MNDIRALSRACDRRWMEPGGLGCYHPCMTEPQTETAPVKAPPKPAEVETKRVPTPVQESFSSPN